MNDFTISAVFNKMANGYEVWVNYHFDDRFIASKTNIFVFNNFEDARNFVIGELSKRLNNLTSDLNMPRDTEEL